MSTSFTKEEQMLEKPELTSLSMSSVLSLNQQATNWVNPRKWGGCCLANWPDDERTTAATASDPSQPRALPSPSLSVRRCRCGRNSTHGTAVNYWRERERCRYAVKSGISTWYAFDITILSIKSLLFQNEIIMVEEWHLWNLAKQPTLQWVRISQHRVGWVRSLPLSLSKATVGGGSGGARGLGWVGPAVLKMIFRE